MTAALLRLRARPAEARRVDRHICLGQRRGQPGLQRGQLFALAAALQAFHQPVQRPHIVEVLGALEGRLHH